MKEPLWKKAKKDPNVPIYSYRCKQCENLYEYFHVNSEDKKPKCPKCGSNDGLKQVSKDVGHVIRGASAKNRYGLR